MGNEPINSGDVDAIVQVRQQIRDGETPDYSEVPEHLIPFIHPTRKRQKKMIYEFTYCLKREGHTLSEWDCQAEIDEDPVDSSWAIDSIAIESGSKDSDGDWIFVDIDGDLYSEIETYLYAHHNEDISLAFFESGEGKPPISDYEEHSYLQR